MRKSKVVERMLEKLTPEKLEEMRVERDNHRKSISVEYQLGFYIGEYIVTHSLPTISIDAILTNNCIDLLEEEEVRARELNDTWYNKKSFGNADIEWINLRNFHKEMENKYLPHTLNAPVPYCNVSDAGMKEFRDGLRASLWDCDCCHYDIDNIEIVDVDSRFTDIVLKLRV